MLWYPLAQSIRPQLPAESYPGLWTPCLFLFLKGRKTAKHSSSCSPRALGVRVRSAPSAGTSAHARLPASRCGPARQRPVPAFLFRPALAPWGSRVNPRLSEDHPLVPLQCSCLPLFCCTFAPHHLGAVVVPTASASPDSLGGVQTPAPPQTAELMSGDASTVRGRSEKRCGDPMPLPPPPTVLGRAWRCLSVSPPHPVLSF